MNLLNIELCELLDFAKAYSNLGGSVQEQLNDLLDGCGDEVNPNAIKLIQDRLGGKNEELDLIISEFNMES